MYRTKETPKWNNGSTVKPKRKAIPIILFIVLSGILILQGCNTENGNASNIDIANKKVSDLFVGGKIEKANAEGFNTIKDSTDEEKIEAAMDVVDNINEDELEQNEEHMLVFTLETAVSHAQIQLKEREARLEVAETRAQEEKEVYQPDEDDVVWKNNELKNKDILEEFMKVAGENGKNSTSEIRVVKDEGVQGVLIYDLKSMYDKNADQSWIRVTPDVSHYWALENEAQDVFNNAPQQCGYMSKDETEGFYKLFECRTHWEYRLLPTVDGIEQ